MSITQRFGLLTFIAALGLIGLASFSLHQMERIFAVANFADTNSLPSVLVLDDAYREAMTIEGLLWQHIAMTDTDKMAVIEQKLNLSTLALLNALEKYEKDGLIVNERDHALLIADYAAQSALNSLRTSVVYLSKSKKKDAALKLMLDGQGTFSNLSDAMQAHRILNYDLGKHSAGEAESTLQYALRFHMVITGLVIVFVVLVGVILFTSLPSGSNAP
ncbi:MCP four helix bundle domain-containing protein [Candidatus Methylospira mobilis]|uniref:MCP four helix bundle domain-containing protein n=1 Tax=Candidatus Methylospira mobilis TaxID=1808979 RepID=UPI0028F06837|nr:MCP four helix bundle domain-containing protein [Candidatus Methylospira mobilis]WNV04103.1 MCP four helix bundle domain-containing protein [Candidatus Methylospira mobilis]